MIAGDRDTCGLEVMPRRVQANPQREREGAERPGACVYVWVCVCHVVAGPVCAAESDGVGPSEYWLTS